MPEPAFDLLAYWKRHAHLLTDGLLQRVDELSVSDYPAETPNELICFLQDFMGELGQLIEKTDSEDRLRAYSSLVQRLAQSLDWLDNAHTGQTPRSLVQVLRHLIGELTPGSRVVARPQAEYNYSIGDLGKMFQSLVESYVPKSRQAAFDKYLARPLKLISFPRIDRDNILAHAIFGHELGHPIASSFLESEEAKDAYKTKQSEVQKLVVELVDKMPAAAIADAARKLEMRTRLFDSILQIRKRAMEELVSDAVGILIFGPSAFFAMFELLWGGDWDALPVPNEWYPPSRMRVRLMLKLLDELKMADELWAVKGEVGTESYVEAAKGFVQHARALVADVSDEEAINNDPRLKIAYEWMHASLVDATAFAIEKTASVSFKTEPAFTQLAALIRRLELGVPPNEVGDPSALVPVDHRAALLAAWLFKLRGLNPRTGDRLTSSEVGDLHMQTMRAIEYVILQDEYVKQATAAAAA